MCPVFTPNPNAEASASFDVVKPGIYKMRIEGSENFPAISEFTSKEGNPCLKARFVFADRGSLSKLDGSPANNPGAVIDAGLSLLPEKQGKLRSLVEACGLSWGSFSGNTDELLGKELDVKIKTDTYEGEIKNSIARYMAAAK